MQPIYLDYCATTPASPLVVEAMLPYLQQVFGNPDSRHRHGADAAKAVRKARAQVALLIGAQPNEVAFTSGATEAINLAIRGCVAESPGSHIVTSAIEHKAVLDTCRSLECYGHEVTYVEPDSDGVVGARSVSAALRPQTALVAVMWVNNETGVVSPVDEIAAACRAHGSLFFTDATQAAGHLPIDLVSTSIDMLALSAHKLHGPKGVGALIAQGHARDRLTAQTTGGGQEGGLRSGTLNVPGIVGFGAAAAQAVDSLHDADHCRALRDRLQDALVRSVDGVCVNGGRAERAPHCLNVSFAGVDGEALLANLPQLAFSTGSACNSTALEPSHVLRAMGYSQEEAYEAVRLSVGRQTTEEEIDRATEIIVAAVRRIRQLMSEG